MTSDGEARRTPSYGTRPRYRRSPVVDGLLWWGNSWFPRVLMRLGLR